MFHNSEIVLTKEALKRHAKRLQKEINQIKPGLKLTEAQNLLAKSFGMNNWHEMNETADKNRESKELNDRFIDSCENGYNIIHLLENNPHVKFNIAKGLLSAAKNGQLEVLIDLLERYLPQNPHIKLYQIDKHRCYNVVCNRGNIEIIDYLLYYYEKYNIDLIGNKEIGFYNACENGQFQLVKYLLESSKIKGYLNKQEIIDEGFLRACQGEKIIGKFGKEQIEIVKYLLKEPSLKYNANINVENDKALINAALSKELLEYLLSSPELKYHANIYNQDGEIFNYFCKITKTIHTTEFVEYILNDYKINQTLTIVEILNKYPEIKQK